MLQKRGDGLEIQNKITLEDDFTFELLEIIEHTKDFRKQIQEAKENVDELNKIKATAQITVDNKEAIKEISETKKQINEIKKNVSFVIVAKDSASESIQKIRLQAKSLVDRPFTAIIKVKDEISNVIGGITDKLFSLKTLAAGIVLGGTGKGIYDFTLGQGVSNENYLATLQTVLNDKQKGNEALAWSYQQALKTPFRANEVVSGVSSLAVSQMDYKKFLMPLGNLAAVKNKPLDQSIEFAATLASGDMGEAVARGRDLGISKQMWEKAGMSFDKQGSMTNTPDEALNAVLEIIESNHWDKLMDNKSNTAEGLMSNMADTGLSFGRALAGINKGGEIESGGPFDVFKKQLQTIQPLLDGLYTSDGFKKLTDDVKNLVAIGGNKFQGFLKGLSNKKTVEEYEKSFNRFIKDVKAGWEVAKEFAKAVGTIGTALKPVFSLIAEHPKLFADLFLGIGAVKIGGSIFKGVSDSFKDIKGIVKEFPKLNNALKSMVKNGGGGLKGVLKLPFTGIKQGFNSIKGLGNSIGSTGKNVAKSLSGPLNTAIGTTRLWAGTLGQVLKNSLSSAFRTGYTGAINLTKAFGRNLGVVLRGAGSIASSAGRGILGFVKTIPGGLNSAIGTVKLWIGTLGNLLKSRLLTVIRTVASGIMNIIRPLFLFIAANPIVLIITAIIGVCVLLYAAWKNNWGGIRDKTHEVIEFCKQKIDSIKETFENIKQKVADFKKDVEEKWNALKEFFAHPIKGTINLFKKLIGGGEDDVGNNALGTSYWTGGPTWIAENGPEIVELPAGSKVYNNSQTMRMLNGAKNVMPNMNFTSGISNKSKSMVPEAAKWGEDIPEGMARGIRNNIKTVTSATTLMASKIKELIHFTSPDKGPLADFDTYAVDMMKTYGTGIQNNIKSVTTPTTNMSTGVKNIYTDLKNQSLTYGQGIVQELGAGIQSNVGNLTSIVKALTDKVIEEFKTGFGIHSPSLVMYKLAQYLPQGFINGLTSTDVGAFIKNWIGSMVSVAGGAISGNLSGWIAAAMALTGVGADWFSPLATLIQHESGGDPMSINLWDSNAAAGHPSKGLMQLIDENMQDWHLPGMDNIYDPVSNIAAGIRLILHDYGSIYNVPGIRALASGGSYVGYATGTDNAAPGLARINERGWEFVDFTGGESVLNNVKSVGLMEKAASAISSIKNSIASINILKPMKKLSSDDKFEPLLNKNKPVTINLKKDDSKQKPSIIIAKLAEQIVVREENDIDKIATALVKKLTIAEMNI